MESVPLEVLDRIISYLEHHDISKLTMLNHKYRKNFLRVLYKNPCIKSLNGLERLRDSAMSLGFIDLIETIDLSNVPGRWNQFTNNFAKLLLSSAPLIKHLNFSNCSNLTDSALKYVASCKHLKSLNLSECKRLTTASPLHLCSNLDSLDLSLCYRIRDFSSVFALENLEFLNVSGTKFTNLDLSNLFKLKNVKAIDISKCYNIVEVEADNKPDSLEIIVDSLETGEVEWEDSD